MLKSELEALQKKYKEQCTCNMGDERAGARAGCTESYAGDRRVSVGQPICSNY